MLYLFESPMQRICKSAPQAHPGRWEVKWHARHSSAKWTPWIWRFDGRPGILLSHQKCVSSECQFSSVGPELTVKRASRHRDPFLNRAWKILLNILCVFGVFSLIFEYLIRLRFIHHLSDLATRDKINQKSENLKVLPDLEWMDTYGQHRCWKNAGKLLDNMQNSVWNSNAMMLHRQVRTMS